MLHEGEGHRSYLGGERGLVQEIVEHWLHQLCNKATKDIRGGSWRLGKWPTQYTSSVLKTGYQQIGNLGSRHGTYVMHFADLSKS